MKNSPHGSPMMKTTRRTKWAAVGYRILRDRSRGRAAISVGAVSMHHFGRVPELDARFKHAPVRRIGVSGAQRVSEHQRGVCSDLRDSARV